MTSTTRRTFLGAAGLAAVVWPGLGRATGCAADDSASDALAPTFGVNFPAQDDVSVSAVVGASHRDFDRVRELVDARPALANATWDWGFGDWESALGAASHMGRRDIASYLMDRGARPDVFAFTALGKLGAVRAMIDASPGLQRTRGPHGIRLLQHARNAHRRAKDESSQQLVNYLTELGDADPQLETLELTESDHPLYVGRYRFGPGKNERFRVFAHRSGRLALERDGGVMRFLHYIQTHTFAPSGAHAVRIRFAVEEGSASYLTVHDAQPIVKAVREP